jgi:hypothetical protein
LAVLAFAVYVAHIHTNGYGGDANLYHEAARNSDWFVRPLHFGYVMLLDFSFTIFGPVTPNLFVVQGLFSAIAGAVSVWLVVYISRAVAFEGNLPWSMVTGAFFAFSGGILITANYGETYMIQIAFILAASVMLLKHRLLIAGSLLGASIAFTPLSLLLMPIVLAVFSLVFFDARSRVRGFGVVLLGAASALAIAGILFLVLGTAEFSGWINDVKISVFNFEGRGPYQRNFVLVQFAWLARGFHVILPLILIGTTTLAIKRTSSGLALIASAVLLLLLNLTVMGRVDDYWRMMMIFNVYGAIFATVGLRFVIERVRVLKMNAAVAASLTVVIFGLVSLTDMPQREIAVADEIYEVYETIKDTENPALIISLWENVDSGARYGRDENRQDLPVLVAYPPIQNWVPPEAARATVADARKTGIPIYVIVRNKRYDSPLMRLILGTVNTNFYSKYQSILPQYDLRELGSVGEYHKLYYAEPL